jgi:hypothetical protein
MLSYPNTDFPQMQRFKADKQRYKTMIQCPDDDMSKKGGIDVV